MRVTTPQEERLLNAARAYGDAVKRDIPASDIVHALDVLKRLARLYGAGDSDTDREDR